MASKVYEYPGEKIQVRYDVKRCIHAAECTRGLPGVFDTGRKPWIDPEQAPADAVAEVVMRCPTGALHFTRLDGGPGESAPDKNTVAVSPDGPLYVQGDLEVVTPEGEVLLKDTRLALCRCGASKNKPFCDNSHIQINFKESGALGRNVVKTVESGSQESTLKIIPGLNGPFTLKGPAEIVSADGQTRYQGNRMFLCRCGASGNKPFCDGTHSKIGFVSGE